MNCQSRSAWQLLAMALPDNLACSRRRPWLLRLPSPTSALAALRSCSASGMARKSSANNPRSEKRWWHQRFSSLQASSFAKSIRHLAAPFFATLCFEPFNHFQFQPNRNAYFRGFDRRTASLRLAVLDQCLLQDLGKPPERDAHLPALRRLLPARLGRTRSAAGFRPLPLVLRDILEKACQSPEFPFLRVRAAHRNDRQGFGTPRAQNNRSNHSTLKITDCPEQDFFCIDYQSVFEMWPDGSTPPSLTSTAFHVPQSWLPFGGFEMRKLVRH